MDIILKFLRHLSILSRERFFQVLVVALAVVFMSAGGVFYFEHVRRDSNISSLWDGIWWAMCTMSTVGYGDKYPVSLGGRIVGLFPGH